MQQNTNIILSLGSGPCTILQGQDSQCRSQVQTSTTQTPISCSEALPTRAVSLMESLQPSSTNSPSPSNPADSKKAASRSSGSGQGQSSGDLDLRVDVTNVWFGTTRCKPQQPVLITEKGITMQLKVENKGA